ncbi:GNAT family N-acetyltransferase [Aquibacillus sp. 3ASR75-11]|uniref:GNAT family N-acetyltransferase n=1 Tax=Terrihalobacillus insolitus TaxID=2950438 RepID=A0A9X3WSU0_9BACI|nr:GNAT family N-acetyltransferase [Terrihalobacillus insolitus]MDC3413151.1 GNAT family N-acetyltransferase [Terrihalobacillus insolitus]MDC3425177.1 GNAT family N-acetyltransferase [Terrihalobacillus insolitus]
MQWKKKLFDVLTVQELYAILKARVDVFVVEQNCPYGEIDNYDQVSTHLYLENDGEIIAYARLLPRNVKYKEASIGRVLVNQTYRKNGYAKELLERSIAVILEEWKEPAIKIQGQEYLRQFYGSFGFKEISDIYLEDDIPHVDMLLRT